MSEQINIPLLSIETDPISNRNVGDSIKFESVQFLRCSKQDILKRLMGGGELTRVVVLVKTLLEYLK